MTTQAIMKDDGSRLYSVNRDVAHNFGFVAQAVAERLEGEQWSFLKKLCEEHDITMDDLGEACRSFCLFVASATENRGESMVAAMRRTGYYDVKEPAQVAYMATLGAVMVGIYWTGVHEATLGGVGPCQRMQDLIAFGELSAKRLLVPRWKRVLYKLLARWEATWAALKGKSHGQVQGAGNEQDAGQVPAGGAPNGRAGTRVPRRVRSQSEQGDGAVVQERAQPESGGGPVGGSDQVEQA